jgi:hypothetical protein
MYAAGMVIYRTKKTLLQKGALVSPIQKRETDEMTKIRTRMMGRLEKLGKKNMKGIV